MAIPAYTVPSMSGDNASSRDSAVIDEDLVEALGFEPLSTGSSATVVTEDTDAVSSAVTKDEGDDDLDHSEVAEEAGSTDLLDEVDEEESTEGGLEDGEVITQQTAGDETSEDRSLFVDPEEETPSSSSEDSGVVILGDVAPVEAGLVSEDLDLRTDSDDETSQSLFGDRVGSPAELISDNEALIESVEADGAQLGGAFPEVPALTDDHVSAEFDDRELLTQPVMVGVDELEVGDFDLAPDAETAAELIKPDPTPVGVPPAKRTFRRKRVRAKKTRRVIRHIDPWSVLTFSFLFHLAVYAAFLLASVLVWRSLEASGMVVNIEDFIIALGDYETYEINADVLFRAAVVIAGILTVASTILSVLLCVVFNLISDLVGGIRVTVLEEETVRLPAKQPREKSK